MRAATAWGGRKVGVIAVRRVGLIVALGALLGMLAGAATASPALADRRGDGWSIGPAEPFTLPALYCGFEVRVTTVVNEEFTKILKTADGSMTFLFTGAITTSFTNLQTGKTITEKMNGPGKFFGNPDGSFSEVHTGLNGPFFLTPADAKRFGLPTVSVTAGALRFSIDTNGAITSLTLDGRVAVDVCAALS
jgi:hypothetical protein